MAEPTTGNHRLSDLVAKKRRDIEQALQRFTSVDDPETLHDLRVALRRLQSLLRIISHSSAEPLQRLFKTTNRARDLEVFIRIVRQSKLPLPRQKKIWQQQLTKEIHELQCHVSDTWHAAATKLPDSFDEKEDIRHHAAKQLQHEIRRLKTRRKRLCHHWDDRAAHKLRISGKHIRYLLEPFAIPGNPIEQCIDALKSFQDLLGEYHDRTIMLSRLEDTTKTESATDILTQEMLELRDRFITRHCQATDTPLDTLLYRAQQQLAQT